MTASLELEQCIADALAAVPMISSSALAALYSEVEVAAAEADVAAREAKDAAIDVVRSSDGRAARAAMEEAAITKDRLQNSLPRLRARMLEVVNAERCAAWLAAAEKLSPVRDNTAVIFNERIPQLLAELVDCFEQVTAVDRAIADLNGTSPSGAGYHLDAIDPGKIISKFVIPAMQQGGKQLWPVRDMAAFAAMFAPVGDGGLSFPGGDWWKVAQEKNRQLLARAEAAANR